MRAVPGELKGTGYEIFVAILSILSIVNLVLGYAFRDDPDLLNVLLVMNALLSVIFLGDFVYRLVTAPARGAYFFRHFGWADLLASVPVAEFKVLRIFRLVRVYRLLATLGVRPVLRALVRDRAGSALLTLLLAGILILEFGSLQILYLEENAPDANITTASDALWYTIVTISTVGYGDQYPVTNAGRVVGTLVVVVGVGIFGTFTGYLANAFLAPRRKGGETSGATGEPATEAAPSEAGADVAATRDSETLDELRELVTRPDVSLEEVDRLLAQRRAGDA